MKCPKCKKVGMKWIKEFGWKCPNCKYIKKHWQTKRRDNNLKRRNSKVTNIGDD